ncbi:MAG: mannitol dehydrogenase family protein [Actinomycetota bacterium]
MTSPATARPLDPASLAGLAEAIGVPTYDRDALVPGILHIGVGGFHRAHLATYCDELARSGRTDWAIVGCGVLEGDAAMASVLTAQQGLYTLVTKDARAVEIDVIGSITEFIHAWPDPHEAIERIADPAIQVISLTITEGGYPVDDVTGRYLPHSPNAGPGSAFGIIAAGLQRRRMMDSGPVTVLSCDNIMSNGHVTEAATRGEAERIGPDLVAWLGDSVSFPNSMVDRITPVTSSNDRLWLRETHGIDDGWPVMTEPFRQWVVEDRFAGRRPPLEDLDVIVTDDVEPYEFMKLRLLNAGHSCMAYLAALMGIETVDAAMAEPTISDFLVAFLHDEAQPVLPPVEGIDVDAYIATLLERFRNPEIGDQIARLCLDGTAKFPKFLLPTVRANASSGGPVALSALALAAWCQYLLGTDEHGNPIDIADDPRLDVAVEAAESSLVAPAGFLSLDGVFDGAIATAPTFRAAFVEAVDLLRTHKVAEAIRLTVRATDEAHP